MASDEKTLGVVLLVLGILLLLGYLDLPFITWIVAIAAIFVGVLVLLEKLPGATWVAVALIALGILLLVNDPIGAALGRLVAQVVEMAIGLVLVILGVLKLAGK